MTPRRLLGKIIFLALVLCGLSDASTEKIKYSMDVQGKLKPNYCKRGACIKCVDLGDYFGCDKCVKYETRKIGIARCEDLTLQERESKFIPPFSELFRSKNKAQHDGVRHD